MKSYSLKFIFFISLIFQSFSFFCYLLNFSSLFFPHIAIFIGIISMEKSVKKRVASLGLNLLLFLQLSEPASAIFITLLFIQLYLINMQLFDITTFDVPVVAFIAAFTSNIFCTINYAIMLYINTGKFFISDNFFHFATSSILIIIMFTLFKKNVSRFYIRDSWI